MQLWTIKNQLEIPLELGSCHTALVDNYFVEGHVPASDILRLLNERPDARGLCVPGMPIGSPGMEMGAQKEPFETFQQAKFAEAQSEKEFEREKELVDLERANKLENIEKKARVMADTPGNPFFGDLEGAINELSRKELYGVQDMPGEQREQKIEETVNAFLGQAGADPSERGLYTRQATVIIDRELIEKDNENIKLGINPIIAPGRKDYVDGETYYSGETDEFFIFDSSNPENPFTKVDVKR